MYSKPYYISDSNRSAVETCLKSLRSEINELIIISGPSGCGKTHLLLQIKRIFKHNTVMYCTAESFVNAIKDPQNKENLKNLIDNADILLIDDGYHLSGRPLTQEEVAVILNYAIKKVKVFLAIDDINGLEMLIQGLSPPPAFARVSLADVKLKLEVLNHLVVERNIYITSAEKKKVCTGAHTINQLYGYVQRIHLETKMKKE